MILHWPQLVFIILQVISLFCSSVMAVAKHDDTHIASLITCILVIIGYDWILYAGGFFTPHC